MWNFFCLFSQPFSSQNHSSARRAHPPFSPAPAGAEEAPPHSPAPSNQNAASHPILHHFPSLPPLGVVLRAANQDNDDCRWQSCLCLVPQSGKGGVVGIFLSRHHSTNRTPSVSPYGLPAPPLGSRVQPPLKGEAAQQRRRGQQRYAEYHFRATPRNLARSPSLDFWLNSKFGKRRNTVCISRFSN